LSTEQTAAFQRWLARAQEVRVGFVGAGEDGTEGSQGGAGGLRRCLRPSDCPYARPVPGALAAAAVWGATLAELLPGDPDLAWEITELVVAESSLGPGRGMRPGASVGPDGMVGPSTPIESNELMDCDAVIGAEGAIVCEEAGDPGAG
jgi:hypothetical protein